MCTPSSPYGDAKPIQRTPMSAATVLTPGLMLVNGAAGRGGRLFRDKPKPPAPKPVEVPQTPPQPEVATQLAPVLAARRRLGINSLRRDLTAPSAAPGGSSRTSVGLNVPR